MKQNCEQTGDRIKMKRKKVDKIEKAHTRILGGLKESNKLYGNHIRIDGKFNIGLKVWALSG